MGNSLQSLQRHGEEDEGVNAIEEQLIREGTCEICIELFTPETLFQNNNLCVHPFCVECIATYIETKIGENVGKIPCPALDCENQLDPVFCSSIISKQLFDKWCDALCNSAVLEFQNRTYCPNQLCSALVINECDDKSVKEVMCPNCKQYFCFKCQIPWHTGYRCHEVGQFRDRNDVLFGQLAERRRWSRCYRCGECIERVGGCRVVHCRCGAYHCFECGRPAHFGPCRMNNVILQIRTWQIIILVGFFTMIATIVGGTVLYFLARL